MNERNTRKSPRKKRASTSQYVPITTTPPREMMQTCRSEGTKGLSRTKLDFKDPAYALKSGAIRHGIFQEPSLTVRYELGQRCLKGHLLTEATLIVESLKNGKMQKCCRECRNTRKRQVHTPKPRRGPQTQIGDQLGNWTVLGRGPNFGKAPGWECICNACGHLDVVRSDYPRRCSRCAESAKRSLLETRQQERDARRAKRHRVIDGVEHRRCAACQQFVPLGAETWGSSASYCRACVREDSGRRRQSDPEACRAYIHNSEVKRRRQRAIWASDVSSQDIQRLRASRTICPLCRKRMSDEAGHPHKKHVDHVIPLNAGGTHTIANIRVICARCNIGRPKDGSDFEGQMALWARVAV